VKKSIYSGSNPVQIKSSQDQGPAKEKECQFSKYEEGVEEEPYEAKKSLIKIEQMREQQMRTPSPATKAKRIMLDSMNSFSGKSGAFENILVKRELSFGQNQNHSNENSTRKRFEDEEEEEDLTPKTRKKICCNCKKSRCLKLYCDCFARGEFCGKDCNCVSCLNTEANVEERQNAMMTTLDRNPNAFKPKVDKSESPTRVNQFCFRNLIC